MQAIDSSRSTSGKLLIEMAEFALVIIFIDSYGDYKQICIRGCSDILTTLPVIVDEKLFATEGMIVADVEFRELRLPRESHLIIVRSMVKSDSACQDIVGVSHVVMTYRYSTH
jgi:hypothetical protein